MTINNAHRTIGSGEHLLLVDHDENETYVLAALLQRFHYYVITARTAERALESMAASAPFLILTAQKLPDMSGPDLIRKVRQIHGTADVPVIVLDAARVVGAEKVARVAGAAAYLTKPVSLGDLYCAVQSATETTPRKHIRIETNLPVTIDGDRLDYESGECVSVISEQGMHVKVRGPRQLKKRPSAEIRILGRVIPVLGEVLYRHEPHNTVLPEPGIGLKFVQISSDDRQYIRRYVHAEVVKGIDAGKRKYILDETGSADA